MGGHVMGGRGRLATLLAIVVLVASACAVSSSPGSSPAPTIRPSDGASASDEPASPVVGTVVSVDPPAPPSPSASPGKTPKPPKSPVPTASPSSAPVKGFTLLTTAGTTLTFVIGELDNIDDFPPDSLYDRMSTEDPIRVFFTVDGPNLIVHHIEDAG